MLLLGFGIYMFSYAVSAEPIDIGTRLELMVDDYLIDKIDGDAERTAVIR